MNSFFSTCRRAGLVTIALLTGFVLIGAGWTFAAPEAVPGTAPAVGKTGDARMLVTITRFGSFLKIPEKEPLELFRRFGRALAPHLEKHLSEPFDAADFVPAETAPKGGKPQPVKAALWTPAQRAAVEELRLRETGLLSSLMKAVPFPDDGLHLIAVIEPQSLVSQLEEMLETPEAKARLRPGQMMKVQNRLLPFLRIARAVGVVMRFTPAGFVLEIQMQGSDEFATSMMPDGVVPSPLSCAKYINNDSFLSFAQVHPPIPPSETLQTLRSIPQTVIVENYLASAGLEFERDILSNPGVESVVSLDLNPTGEGGLPDFRAAVRVKDPLRLMALIPQLKQLAMNVGVMVAPNLEKRPTAKVSYFLLPNVGVHIGMTGEYLLLSTGRDSLLTLADRIESISAAKIPGFEGVPADAHRYWRIRFDLLNEQLQKFLQSPLIAGRGIPPLSNLNVANELGDLIMVTRIREDGINMRLDLPTAAAVKK